jgi:hypothetical protein
MVSVVMSTDDGERFELEISEQNHVLWQIGTGEPEKDERGYCQWSELESDLAEGISGVNRKLVEAVQLWRDNYMLANPRAIPA